MILNFKPLHPERLDNPEEGAFASEWKTLNKNSDVAKKLLAAPVSSEYPENGELFEVGKFTGGFYHFPYGYATKRDQFVMSELIQWLGTPVGFSFLVRSLNKAGWELARKS